MKIKDKRIFISGGAGFIGSHLMEEFIEDNDIVVFDNFSRDSLSSLNLDENKNLEIIKGNILNKNEIKNSLRDSDIIIHLAAVAGVDTVINRPVLTFRINLLGTFKLLEVASKLDIERFVDFSTSEVYGRFANNVSEKDNTSQGPIDESRWVYSVSKLAGEYLTHSYFRENGFPIVSLRPFNIYGPRQVGEGAVHNFIKMAISNRDLIIHGNGKQTRSWCYIDDMVKGVKCSIMKKEVLGESFNIGNSDAKVTTEELARLIITLSGSKSDIRHRGIDYPDVEERSPDIEKARALLGYSPEVGLEEGIKRTVEWYKNSGLQ